MTDDIDRDIEADIDRVMAMSDDELHEELRRLGLDPRQLAADGEAIIRQAMEQHFFAPLADYKGYLH